MWSIHSTSYYSTWKLSLSEWNYETSYNMNEGNVKENKPDTKGMNTIWFHLEEAKMKQIKVLETESKWWLPRAGGGGEWGVIV